MAPRESNLFHWLRPSVGSNGFHSQTPVSGQQQLFHSSMLPLWLATVLTRQEICIAILCGAPCSGKTEAARKMMSAFGEALVVVSDDLACDFHEKGKNLFPVEPRPQDQFEALLPELIENPRIVLCDSGNTQFGDYAAKLSVALAAGVKIQNFAWFVFDQGLPEQEEVDHLLELQQKRLNIFWEDRTAAHASDGKVMTSEAVRQAVRQVRAQYFQHQDLRPFTTEWIINELLEFVAERARHTPLFAPPSAVIPRPRTNNSAVDSRTSFPGGVFAALPRPDVVSTHPAPRSSAGSSLGPAYPRYLTPSAGALGGTAMHSTAMPIIGLPTDQSSPLYGDPPALDNLPTPPPVLLPDLKAKRLPLQQQFNTPSSAASPPFTVTNPITSSGDQPAVAFPFDGSAFSQCIASSPDDFFMFAPADGHSSGPSCPSPNQPGEELSKTIDPSKKRCEQKNGHCKGYPLGAGCANGYTNGHTGDHPTPHSHGHLSGHVNGHLNGHLNGHTTADYPNGHTKGHVNGYGNGRVNGLPSLPTNGELNGILAVSRASQLPGPGHGHLNGHTNGHTNGLVNGAANGASNGHTNGTGNGHTPPSGASKGRGKAKASRGAGDSSKGKSHGRSKKAATGWAGGTATALKGPTLRSVLNEYWQTHKSELDTFTDFDVRLREGLQSQSSLDDFDEDVMLNSLQALLDDGDETAVA